MERNEVVDPTPPTPREMSLEERRVLRAVSEILERIPDPTPNRLHAAQSREDTDYDA